MFRTRYRPQVNADQLGFVSDYSVNDSPAPDILPSEEESVGTASLVDCRKLCQRASWLGIV
jgi:hypothetical protein